LLPDPLNEPKETTETTGLMEKRLLIMDGEADQRALKEFVKPSIAHSQKLQTRRRNE